MHLTELGTALDMRWKGEAGTGSQFPRERLLMDLAFSDAVPTIADATGT
jgi:hypothetical protein